MQVSVQSGEGLERRMTVELPTEDVNLEVEKRLKDIAKTARMDGFRPGKIPMRVLRTRFGLQVQQEVFGDLVQSTYPEALIQENLRPAGPPSIEPDLGQGQDESRFAYTAVFEVLPEVELASLADKSIQRPRADLNDEDVQEMIDRLRDQRKTWNEVEREARDGDQVQVSFKGFIDGEAFEGGEANDVPLVLGSGSMIEGFESGLIGAKAGDSRKLETRFPDDYRVESLAGKEAVFEAEVGKVSEPVVPEVDGEFAKSFGVENGDTERFRADIRKNMERELKQRTRSRLKSQALDALLEAHQLDVPTALVDQEIDALREQTRQNVGGQGGNMELPRELFEEQARRRVALGLLIAEVVKANEIRIDQDRVKETIQEMAATYESPQEVIEYYNSNQQQRASIENLVLEEQVVDWIVEQVQVEDVQSSFKEVTEGKD